MKMMKMNSHDQSKVGISVTRFNKERLSKLLTCSGGNYDSVVTLLLDMYEKTIAKQLEVA